MANYYATARTNYFAVKDVDAFKKELKNYSVDVIEDVKDGVTLYGFIDDNDGGFPSEYWDDSLEDDRTINWEDFFNRHLADDSVAVMVEVGAEKHRYLNGYAVAYNNKGETAEISLDEIYVKAESLLLGKNITRAEY